MGSNMQGAATSAPMKTPAFDREAAVTRSLLGYGVVAGPFYLVVSLIQVYVRDGFDLARHPLSVLANGTGGWVQTAMRLSACVGIGGAAYLAAAVVLKSKELRWLMERAPKGESGKPSDMSFD